MIVYVLAAILIFGVLIAVHEFGHFITAKLCGVRVNEFSIYSLKRCFLSIPQLISSFIGKDILMPMIFSLSFK